MIGKLLRDVQLRMRSWWLHDRIRVSPLEGKLLRIHPGDLVQVGETQAQVTERSVVENTDGCTVSLNCWTSTGEVVLQVEMTSQGDVSAILWKEHDRWRELSLVELEVWLRHRVI